jgi:hypothetical protein
MGFHGFYESSVDQAISAWDRRSVTDLAGMLLGDGEPSHLALALLAVDGPGRLAGDLAVRASCDIDDMTDAVVRTAARVSGSAIPVTTRQPAW